MQNEAKISLIVALVLVATAFYNLTLAASVATIYLIVYAVRRLRKQRTS